MKEKTFKIGERVVIFQYTNTTPITSGILTAQTEHFVEIEEQRFGKPKSWHAKENAEPTIQ